MLKGNRAPLILSRNVWAGAAAHGVALWSSDITCSWKEFRAQVIVGMSAGLSGIPYWSSDVSTVISNHLSIYCSVRSVRSISFLDYLACNTATTKSLTDFVWLTVTSRLFAAKRLVGLEA